MNGPSRPSLAEPRRRLKISAAMSRLLSRQGCVTALALLAALIVLGVWALRTLESGLV